MTNIDINAMANDILSKFQTDNSDYGYSDTSQAAVDLVALIRAVVRTEVEDQFRADPETALARTEAMAEAAQQEEFERTRCPHVDPVRGQCKSRKWHVGTVNLTEHRF